MPRPALSRKPSSARAISDSLVLRDLDEESGGHRQKIRGRYPDLVLREVPGNPRQNPREPQRPRAAHLPASRCPELLGVLDGFLSRSRGVGPPLKTTPQEVLRILRAPFRLGLLAALLLARSLPASSLARAHSGIRMKPPAADPTRPSLRHGPWCPSSPRPRSIASSYLVRHRPRTPSGPLLVSRPGSVLDSAWARMNLLKQFGHVPRS